MEVVMQPKSLRNNQNCCKVITQLWQNKPAGWFLLTPARMNLALYCKTYRYAFGGRGSWHAGEKKTVPHPQGNKLVYPSVSMLKHLKVHYSVILPSKYYVWHKSHETRQVSAVPKETNGVVAAHSIFSLSKWHYSEPWYSNRAALNGINHGMFCTEAIKPLLLHIRTVLRICQCII